MNGPFPGFLVVYNAHSNPIEVPTTDAAIQPYARSFAEQNSSTCCLCCLCKVFSLKVRSYPAKIFCGKCRKALRASTKSYKSTNKRHKRHTLTRISKFAICYYGMYAQKVTYVRAEVIMVEVTSPYADYQ